MIDSGALLAMAPSRARLVAGTIAACLLLPLADTTARWSSHGAPGDMGAVGVLRASAAPALRGWRGAFLGVRLRGGDEDEEEGREERDESEREDDGDLVGRKGGIVSAAATVKRDEEESSGRSSQDDTPEENSVRFLPALQWPAVSFCCLRVPFERRLPRQKRTRGLPLLLRTRVCMLSFETAALRRNRLLASPSRLSRLWPVCDQFATAGPCHLLLYKLPSPLSPLPYFLPPIP